MADKNIAVITGANGQDASYLAELLIEKGYEVHGIVRRYSQPHFQNIQHLIDKDAIRLHEGDLGDQNSLETVFLETKPSEIYNLGAQSHVGVSFIQAEATMNITGIGAARVFDAARKCTPRARIYQAGSSEQLGNVQTILGIPKADESCPNMPASPYGAAKVFAHNMARIYRESYGLFIARGVLHNHESPRRGTLFVTRKVTCALARMAKDPHEMLRLGNLDAVRDWGYSPEFVDGMWRMLQQEKPGDYVLATGEGHSVREFLDLAVEFAGLGDDAWDRIRVDESQKRPNDIHRLVGDAGKAERELGWRAKTRFHRLVRLMVESDRRAVESERRQPESEVVKGHG